MRVLVYEYRASGFLNTPNAFSETESVREYEAKAEATVTVAISYLYEFRESSGWTRKHIKIVVVDENNERFNKVVEKVKTMLENETVLDPDEIVEEVEEIFEPDIYSFTRKIHEVDGTRSVKLIYVLQP